MLRRIQDRSEEGGAVVELALMTMLIVPMVIYTAYVGEAFVTAIKAQEAEISAAWEITAFRLHRYNSGPDAAALLRQAGQGAADRVRADLVDFNSFKNTGSRTGLFGVWGFSSLGEVRCAARDLGNFGGRYGGDFLHQDGWVGCQAQVQFENRKAPANAHHEFFRNKPKIIQDTFKQMTMCGSGATLKGCEQVRGFVLFTDDWGLESGRPIQVGDNPGANPEYYNVGENIYMADGFTGVAQGVLVTTFLAMVGAAEQGQTSMFKMGYLGTITGTRRVPSDGSAMTLHLTPKHELSSAANNNSADLSDRVFGQRDRTNYLGHPDPNWNKQ